MMSVRPARGQTAERWLSGGSDTACPSLVWISGRLWWNLLVPEMDGGLVLGFQR
ncbi:hypothetical protein Hanom_Chr15g01373141 [Helianthus anomalus]